MREKIGPVARRGAKDPPAPCEVAVLSQEGAIRSDLPWNGVITAPKAMAAERKLV